MFQLPYFKKTLTDLNSNLDEQSLKQVKNALGSMVILSVANA